MSSMPSRGTQPQGEATITHTGAQQKSQAHSTMEGSQTSKATAFTDVPGKTQAQIGHVGILQGADGPVALGRAGKTRVSVRPIELQEQILLGSHRKSPLLAEALSTIITWHGPCPGGP